MTNKKPLTERDLQIQIFDYLRWALPDNAVTFHIPLGGSRNRLEAINLKRMGTTAGVPDIVVLYEGQAFFIELKLGARGKLSPAQEQMIGRIMDAGCPVAVCRSLEAVQTFLDEEDIPLRAESRVTEAIRRGFEKAMGEIAE